MKLIPANERTHFDILTLFTASTTPVNTGDLNECRSNFDSNSAYKNKVKVLSVPKFFNRSTKDAPFCGRPLSSERTINNGSSYCTKILGFDGDGNGILKKKCFKYCSIDGMSSIS